MKLTSAPPGGPSTPGMVDVPAPTYSGERRRGRGDADEAVGTPTNSMSPRLRWRSPEHVDAGASTTAGVEAPLGGALHEDIFALKVVIGPIWVGC